ncbi:MAG TPA: hypothetical protein VEA37_14925 [Flavobacterium sp.]|nr:hypothetical protein [Flavobacterium sp.]
MSETTIMNFCGPELVQWLRLWQHHHEVIAGLMDRHRIQLENIGKLPVQELEHFNNAKKGLVQAAEEMDKILNRPVKMKIAS